MAQNTSSSSRTGTISVSGASAPFTVTQSALSCNYSISPTSATIGAGGGSAVTNISAPSGCAWTASSNASWISITSGSSGSGNGTVNLSVASNATASQRVGTVTIGGQTFTVTQGGQSSCTYSVPTYQFIVSDGGYTTIPVTASAGCPWTAVNDSNWMIITSGASGSGNGTIYLFVGANPSGNSRYGNITIGGQTHSILQYGATCTYSLTSTSSSVGAAGAAGAFNITTPDGCSWSATSNNSWLTVSAPVSGSGNGTINYTTASNPGSQRTGTITVAGVTHTVTQLPATYSSPTAVGQNVNTAPPNSNTNLMFSNVTRTGNTTITVLSPEQIPTIPSNFSIYTNNLIYDIATLALYSGNISVTFNVPNVADAASCAKLKILHYENGAWTSAGNATPQFNAGICTLSQTVTSLSPFVVALETPTIGGQGIEADVSSRFTGDGVYQSNDPSLIEEFLIGSASPNPSFNEFQRADVAPYASKGDGILDITDVNLAEQYLISAVASQTAGGPLNPNAPSPVESSAQLSRSGAKGEVRMDKSALLPRVVRASNVTTSAGQTVTVPILVDAEGDETGYSFTLDYNPQILTNTAVTVGNVGGTRAFVIGTTNPNDGVADGKTTFSVRNFPNTQIAAGNGQILVNVTFAVAAGAPAGTTPLTFSGMPTPNSVTNANSQLLATTFAPGQVNITGPSAAGATIGGRVISSNGRGINRATVTLTDADGNIRTSGDECVRLLPI